MLYSIYGGFMEKKQNPEKESLRTLLVLSNQLVNELIENDGALTPELEEQLSKIELSIPAKIDAYSHLMDRLDTEADYWKEKADFYNAIVRACKNTKERIKENLKSAMIDADQKEVAGNNMKFQLRNSNPSLVLDESKIDQSYKMQVVEWVIDKKRIMEDLKNGIKVSGASLETSFSLRSLANKKV